MTRPICESESTLCKHLPNCGELVLESGNRFHPYSGQTPAVVQFQRIAVAYRVTTRILER
ncbi:MULTISPECIES: hypothetical protein [Rhodococcus]|uniref:hypothetical protein n=1 Tax=Rhodococcus globerulus TaxID=33008 RepID=UPI001C584389|nr:hypothetical protein [Rhodococcus globerulus]QXW02959.1 hypothetical protein KYT97_02300 [Rhodococcus globerulus]